MTRERMIKGKMNARKIFLWGLPILIIGLVISCTTLELAFQGARQAGWTPPIEDNAIFQSFIELEGLRFILIHFSLVVLTVFVSIWLFFLVRRSGLKTAVEKARVGWRFWLRWTCANTVGPAVSYLALFALFIPATLITAAILTTFILETTSFPPTVMLVVFLIGLGVADGITGGTASSVMQWLALRQYVPRAGWWTSIGVAAFAVGFVMAIAFAVLILFPGITVMTLEDVSSGIMFTVFVAAFVIVPAAIAIWITGGASGITQWLILRQYSPRVKWLGFASWPSASSVGLAISFTASGIGMVAAGVGATISPLYYNSFRFTSLILLIGSPVVMAAGGAVGGAIMGGALTWLLQSPIAETPDHEQNAA